MLKRFAVEKFKAFSGRLEFDLGSPSNYSFNPEVINTTEGIVSKALIYGFNGCGKSVLGLGLLDIITHLTDRYRAEKDYIPYLNLDISPKSSALFEYEFRFAGSTLLYVYRKAGFNVLLEESLFIDEHEVIRYDYLNDIGEVKLAGAETLKLTSASHQSHQISRVKYVSSNTILAPTHENYVFMEFMKFVENMLMFYSLDMNRYMGFRNGAEKVDAAIINADRVADFEKFLRDAKIDMQLEAGEHNGEKELLVKYGNNSRVSFYTIASTGTKSLALFYYWYMQMEKASFVYMDEFDAFYHFELAESIVEKLKEFTRTQIIMTTHNTDLLSNELLRPDCYYWLNNGIIKPMNELTGRELRQAHNLQKMYKAGAFNGR